jgi:hypothetical protein
MIAFICCSATSGFVLNVSMASKLALAARAAPGCDMIIS